MATKLNIGVLDFPESLLTKLRGYVFCLRELGPYLINLAPIAGNNKRHV